MNIAFLKDLDPALPHVLLLRHAERFVITDMSTSGDVLLTEKGKADARSLGRKLAAQFDDCALFHSPVERCAQTASCLCQGLRDKGAHAFAGGPLAWLGGEIIAAETGFANDRIATQGWKGFLRSWFDGEYPENRISPLARAARLELGLVRRQLEERSGRSGLIVDVTHDWNILLIIEHCLGLQHEKHGVPGFLECITIACSPDGRLTLGYRGKTTVTGDWL